MMLWQLLAPRKTTHTLEAEALWGAEIRTKTDHLRKCVKELNAAIDSDLRDKAAGGQEFGGDREFGRQIRSILAATADDEENELNQKIKKAIDGIEHVVRPHLRRS
jgi:hypothetical protein